MSGESLILEYLLVCGNNGIEFGDGYTCGILSIDDADGLGGVLAQNSILGTVYNTLGIEVTQAIGHYTQIVVG